MIKLKKIAAVVAIYEAKITGSSSFVHNKRIFHLDFIDADDGNFYLFVNNTEEVCGEMSEVEMYKFLVKNI